MLNYAPILARKNWVSSLSIFAAPVRRTCWNQGVEP